MTQNKRLTNEDIRKIENRMLRATPGPWKLTHFMESGPWIIEEDGDIISGTCSRDEDAAFIVHARHDIPDLLWEIARLRGIIDAIEAEGNDALRTGEEIERRTGHTYGVVTQKIEGAAIVWAVAKAKGAAIYDEE